MSTNILLIDDDALLRRSLAFNLERAGYLVSSTTATRWATSGATRARGLRHRRVPDLSPAYLRRQLMTIRRLLNAYKQQTQISARELDVLALLASGKSNQAIADTLIIGTNTVKMHLRHIYAKLDAHNRVQAIIQAR